MGSDSRVGGEQLGSIAVYRSIQVSWLWCLCLSLADLLCSGREGGVGKVKQ